MVLTLTETGNIITFNNPINPVLKRRIRSEMRVFAHKSFITPFPQANELIRGGRLRKTSKGLISLAPFLVGVSVLWTSIDFDNFTDLASARVALDDDTVFTGRAGVGIEGAVPSLSGILLRGRADVLMPLDGKVAAKINETKLTSEREEPVFDVGIGATYAWGETYAFSADVSTQQGEEVGGYSGNIGFKYKF